MLRTLPFPTLALTFDFIFIINYYTIMYVVLLTFSDPFSSILFNFYGDVL